MRVTEKRFGCDTISVVTNRGAPAFTVFEGKFKNSAFMVFWQRLLNRVAGTVYH